MGRKPQDHTGRYVKCNYCWGTGYVFVPSRDLSSGDREFKQTKCPTCDGLGKLDILPVAGRSASVVYLDERREEK